MDAKDRILEILDNFGMSNKKGAEVMCININTFKRNNNDNELRNSFTEKNYKDLVDFLFFEVVKLKKEVLKNSDSLISQINSNITTIIESYPIKESDIVIVDELCKIIDSMENSDVFDNYDVYHTIIQRIEYESTMLGNKDDEWNVTKYKMHLRKTKQTHSKWKNYLAQFRTKTINEILR